MEYEYTSYFLDIDPENMDIDLILLESTTHPSTQYRFQGPADLWNTGLLM